MRGTYGKNTDEEAKPLPMTNQLQMMMVDRVGEDAGLEKPCDMRPEPDCRPARTSPYGEHGPWTEGFQP